MAQQMIAERGAPALWIFQTTRLKPHTSHR